MNMSDFMTHPKHVNFRAKKLFGEMGRIVDGSIAYINLNGGGPTELHTQLATIQDVPELQELQHKAFGPQCIELGWEDAPPMTESLEHAYEDFAQCTTLS